VDNNFHYTLKRLAALHLLCHFVFNQSINTGNTQIILKLNHWCGLRPSVLGQDRSETKKIGLGHVHCGVGLVGLHGVVLWNAIL